MKRINLGIIWNGFLLVLGAFVALAGTWSWWKGEPFNFGLYVILILGIIRFSELCLNDLRDWRARRRYEYHQRDLAPFLRGKHPFS